MDEKIKTKRKSYKKKMFENKHVKKNKEIKENTLGSWKKERITKWKWFRILLSSAYHETRIPTEVIQWKSN